MEWQFESRPSYFGKHRDEIEQGYDEKYGKGKWRIMWLGPYDKVITFDEAIILYEDAYYNFLKNNPLLLVGLANAACEVYDNASTNVKSGFDYHAQENNSNHYQDISVRKCMFRLGLKFKQNEKLIQIRHNSQSSIGRELSPGRVPFHLLGVTVNPQEGWWEPGTVEEFWQSNKILQILK